MSKSIVFSIAVAALCAGAAVAQPAVAPDPNRPETLVRQVPVTPVQIRYSVRCQGCHEPAVIGAPGIADFKRMGEARILRVLTVGVMAPFAPNMTLEEKKELAAYLANQG